MTSLTGRILPAIVTALFAASGAPVTPASHRPPELPPAKTWNTWKLGQSGAAISGPAWITFCSDLRHLRLKGPADDADPVAIVGGDPLGKILFVPDGYRLQVDESYTPPKILCSGYLP